MHEWTRCALIAAAVTLLGACQPEGAKPAPAAHAAAARAAATRAGVPSRVTAAESPLLMPAPGGDGDSWHDTAGREYRLGLVNTPEYDECFGAQATARRKALTARGFRANVYAHDRYGRSVAVVTTAAGLNLNVYLARYGYANDKYLEQFRGENPALAAQLDRAFAAARAERRGLWAACSGARATQTTRAAAANDLDCGDIRQRVQLRQIGVDPYRLDSDGDGTGCESN